MFRKIKKSIKKKLKLLKNIFSKKIPVFYPIYEGNVLKNRCALITGGGSGIGYAIAESFLKNGASVIITGRNKEKLSSAKEKLTQYLGEGQFIEFYELDISNIENLDEKFNIILKKINRKIDILVNNAGVGNGTPIGTTLKSDFEKTIKTNLEGTYFLTQIVYNYMIKENIKGNILNIASSSSLRPTTTPYMLSKLGILGFTKGLAKKAIENEIVVNAIAPGPTVTPMLKDSDDKDINLISSPAGRYALPEEIANLSTILVSDMSRLVVGDTLFVTGGAGIITYDDVEY